MTASTLHISPPVDVPATASRKVDQGFVGFAFESWGLYQYAGNDKTPENFTQNLLATISQKTGSPMQLRAGGTSMDYVRYDPDQKVAITPDHRDSLRTPAVFGPQWIHALSKFKDAKWTLQVPLARHEDGDTTNAVQFLKAMLGAAGGIPNLQAVEIGNEPDLYAGQKARPPSYGPKEYVEEWKKFANAVVGQLDSGDGKIFQACDFATGVEDRDKWTVPAVFKEGVNSKTWIQSVAAHYYQANNPPDLQHALMNHQFTKSLVDRFQDEVKFLSDPHIPFILGEVGDLTGSKDAFAAGLGAALWTVDWSLYCMTIGIARVNFQLGLGFDFAAFWPAYAKNPPEVRGTYYGEVFVADFIGKSGNLRVAPLKTGNPQVTAYAAYNDGQLSKVAIINLDLYQADEESQRPETHVQLNTPDGVKGVKVEKLTGAGGNSQKDIRWADHIWTVQSAGMPVKMYDDTKEHDVERKGVVLKVRASEALLVTMRR